MALVGVRIGAQRTVQLPHDPAFGTPEATTFTIGTLSARVLAFIKDNASEFSGDPSNPENVRAVFHGNKASFATVQYGLRGWSNFADVSGADIKFETTAKTVAGIDLRAVSDNSMESLSLEDIRVLAQLIEEDNVPTAEEGKTSDS